VDFPSPCHAVGHISLVEKPPLVAARVHLHSHQAHPLPSTLGHTQSDHLRHLFAMRLRSHLVQIDRAQPGTRSSTQPVVGGTKRSPPVTARVCLSGGPGVGWGVDRSSLTAQRSGSTLDVREHQGDFAVLRFTRTSNDHARRASPFAHSPLDLQ